MDLYKIRNKISLGVPLSNIKLRVTFYSRVSTEHEEQITSLNNQVTYFTNLIKTNKNWEYIEGYIDEGISGTTDSKRTSFMKMIKDAKENKFDLIITKEISRFSRNTLDSIKYSRELLTHGVAILFINDNINTIFPDSELRLTIMASLAQDEIRRLSERVKFGMNESIKKGVILGNGMIYGYKKDKTTNKLIIIKQEAKIIKRLFNLYVIQKKSLNEIAKIFNNEKIKTRQNNNWTPTSLSRIIRNIKYKGYYCGKKTEVIDYMTKKIKYLPKSEWIIYKDEKKIPQIIEESLWDKANKRIDKNKINKTINKNKYTYSHKIVCKNDNHTFKRRKQCKSTNDYSWLCSNYLNNGKKTCQSPNIRESELNKIIALTIKKLNINYKEFEIFLLSIYKEQEELKSIIKEKVTYQNIYQKIQGLVLENIVAEKLSQNEIKLEININYKQKNNIIRIYKFKRGYNTKGTKKYIINYYVQTISK